MNSMHLFAVASLLSAAAAFSSLANAEPGVAVRAGDVTIGIGDNDRDCRSDGSHRDCRRSEHSDPTISIGQDERRGDRDHHEHDHDADHVRDAH